MQKCLFHPVFLAIVFLNCTSVEHINYFKMRGLPNSTFLPRPVDSIAIPHARISGAISYSSVNKIEFTDNNHPPSDAVYSSSSKSPNIHWRKPPLYGSFSLDFGPFARIVSVSTQTDGSVLWTRFNYYEKPQTPVFPTFFFNVAYNVNFRKK